MLSELRVENLLLIECAQLRLGSGLTAITGETGAGKTVLAHALDLLLGGKPRAGIVRPGASEAYVEGVFRPPPGLLDDPELADLRERLPDGDELVLARRVGAEGRTRAFVQGRSASAADLRELGSRLLVFYGQHEHRRLTLGAAQLAALDSFCGSEHADVDAEFVACHARVGRLRRQLDDLRARAGARERDLDLLAFELAEIDALGPSAGEREQLAGERERLRRVDALRAAAGACAETLAPDAAEAIAVAGLLAEAERAVAAVAGVDPALDTLAGRLSALAIEADDAGAELRAYATGLEGDPQRLGQVEERLEAYERLERKHGGSVEAILAHGERCRTERERLEQAEVLLERAQADLVAAGAEEDALAATLSATRAAAAPRLAERMRAELAELAMPGAAFEVALEPREQRGVAGDERVEFLMAPNAGVPATALRDTASGGELSRAMLALMSVTSGGGTQALVFDEVDAGIGGQTARAVGERLRALGRARQVICITHLPQIAALADAHFRIEKDGSGDLVRTDVEELEGAGVVAELCRMLGADVADAGARRHAEELLAAA